MDHRSDPNRRSLALAAPLTTFGKAVMKHLVENEVTMAHVAENVIHCSATFLSNISHGHIDVPKNYLRRDLPIDLKIAAADAIAEQYYRRYHAAIRLAQELRDGGEPA